jgi:hypothetical protein
MAPFLLQSEALDLTPLRLRCHCREPMSIPNNPHQKRLLMDAIEWSALLERLAGMARFSTEQSTSTHQEGAPKSGPSKPSRYDGVR